MSTQKRFDYCNALDGVPSGPPVDAQTAQRMRPALNVPVESLNDEQLFAVELIRVVVPERPIDGYNYAKGEPVQQDGGWVSNWVQQPSPNRDAIMAKLAADMRKGRGQELASSDWTQLIDTPLSAEQKTAWGQYRQALRDITTQATFPWQVAWPAKPQ